MKPNSMKPISAYFTDTAKNLASVPHPTPPPSSEVQALNDDYIDRVREEVYKAYTKIDHFKYTHLSASQAAVLRGAVVKAKQWLRAAKDRPGFSMVLSGPLGTGKSTLIAALAATMVDVRPIPDENGVFIHHATIKKSRVFEAYQIMALVGKCKAKGWDISKEIGGRDRFYAIFVDDVGREGDLPFVVAGNEQDERHNRYRLLLNHCHRQGIGVFMATNAPIVGAGGSGFDPAFINAIGPQSFDVMLEMAEAGYMVDLFVDGVSGYRAIKGGRS